MRLDTVGHGHEIVVPNLPAVTMRIRTAANVCTQLLTLMLIAMAFCLRAPQVLGLSMEPQIHSGEFVLINTLAYRLTAVKRGDVVAFRHDSPTPQTYLKRVVGVPGDRIAIQRGVVWLNGAPRPEHYVHFRDARSRPPIVVPAGGLYVLGDNRVDSEDSRDWGTLALRDVIGKALFVLWPPQDIAAS